MSLYFSLILNLAYLFSMPFIVDYDNIIDNDIFIIFVYYGIMFNDRNSILEFKQKYNIEKKVFHYIKDYTNILFILEKMINRLLNTFIKYYSLNND